MLQIDGTVKIVPEQITASIGKLNINGQEHQAILQSIIAQNGAVEVVLTIDILEQLIDLLVRTREEARKQETGIYVPRSDDEINVLARAQEEIKNEVRNTK